MSDEAARREEERLSRAMNRQPGFKRPVQHSSVSQSSVVKSSPAAVQKVSFTAPPPSAGAGTGLTPQQQWQLRRQQQEQERKQKEEQEKKAKEEKIKQVMQNRVEDDGPSPVAPPPKTSNVSELDSLISSIETTHAKKPEAHTHTAAKPASDINRTFDDIENILSDIEKKPAHAPAPAPVHAAPAHTPAAKNQLADLDDIVSGLSKQTIQAPKDTEVPTSSFAMFAPTDDDKCGRCNEYVTTDIAYAMNRKWHKHHFTCKGCDSTLHDAFVPFNGQPYCESCYEQRLICAKCNNKITGTHFDAKGKLYHLECGGGEECAKCGKAITDVSFQAMDKMWHPECFCCSNCKKQLQDSFVRKHEELWCKNCFDKTMACDSCGKTLPTSYVTAKEKKYHPECFACGLCRKPLQGAYYENDGVFKCQACHTSALGTCAECGEGLSTQVVKCLDKKYHEQCFKCHSCKKPLSSEFYNVNDWPNCLECASK